ncbi:adenylate/guanylate cyclase domain-containing protein [Pseudonocardia sp. CA-107938]|uniref:adenylate/guanylate cyclase domain-containing protein n=1 Tax=Pseudonocardia sp. CA-107938 TaxID=3240021 RepID=UPI003D90A34F
MWRSLGFPEAGDDEVLFTDHDVAAARAFAGLTAAGIVDAEVSEAVARATAQSASQLAEWQVGLLRRLFEDTGFDQPPADGSLELTRAVLPVLEGLQSYVWRRHLAAAIARMVVHPPSASDATEELTVGFADMVGFTRTTRRRSVAELSEMIEQFGAVTTAVIADGGGRLVKTVGDEVLFVVDEVADGANIALGLRDRVRAEDALPKLRIGLAAGPVLPHFGDVYGEVVNIAARLTSTAHPDSVLVDRGVAEALADDPRFTLHRIKPVSVRGYSRLNPWVLDRRA